MKRRRSFSGQLLVVIATASLAVNVSETCRAQCGHPVNRTWLHLQNREGFASVLWFGFAPTASYGIDPHLCEFDLPPIPPTCPWWNPAFRNIPGREGWNPPQGLGYGTWYDYRQHVSTAQVDTHRVFFGSADSLCNSGHPTVIRWSRGSLGVMCDSALMIDDFGGVIHRIRMDMTDSIVVTHSFIASLLIIRYGALGATSCSLPATRASVVVTDAGWGRDTLRFGFDPIATCGIDQLLCEVEMPVFPVPGIFDARFVGPCAGYGSLSDFRPYQHTAQVDTHRVQLLPGYAGLPLTLRWRPEEVRAICDSAILQDEFGGIIFHISMHTDSLLTISNPAITSARIIRYGQLSSTSVPTPEAIPKEARLFQNYPNPFNPDTRIEFELAVRAHVRLHVFDVLGRMVASLVDHVMMPGRHDVTFRRTGLASGIYFYRMQALPTGSNASAFTDTKAFIVTR